MIPIIKRSMTGFLFVIVAAGLVVVAAGPGTSAVAQLPADIPPASKPCSDDEAKWWEGIRVAARQFAAASNRKEQAIRAARQNGYTGDGDGLSGKQRKKLDDEIGLTRGEYTALVQQGLDRSFSVPVPDRRTTILFTARPDYTEDARAARISGDVQLRTEFRADGTIGESRIVKGLGFGLNEKAVEATQRTVFLPAVKDGKFVTFWQSLSCAFYVR